MRRILLTALLTAALTSAGTGLAIHAHDAREAAQRADTAQVQNYNDGFEDGVCAGSARTAHDAYGFTCLNWK